MTFEDLPENWDDLPLTDPRLVEDVLDLVASTQDRLGGALVVLLCDAQARLLQPVMMSDSDAVTSLPERVRCIATILSAVDDARSSVLVAIARADGLSITATDREWARAAAAGCPPSVRLLGVHLMTLAGSREIPRQLFSVDAS